MEWEYDRRLGFFYVSLFTCIVAVGAVCVISAKTEEQRTKIAAVLDQTIINQGTLEALAEELRLASLADGSQ